MVIPWCEFVFRLRYRFGFSELRYFDGVWVCDYPIYYWIVWCDRCIIKDT